MNDLKTLFKRASECHEYAEFVEYNDYQECISHLNNFKQSLPKDYQHYELADAAAQAALNRITIQRDIKYHKFEREDEFIASMTLMQNYRNLERDAWQKLENARAKSAQSVEVRNEKVQEEGRSVFWSNFGNLSLIFLIFFIFLVYRMVVSHDFQKLKWRNILRAFKLEDHANLIDKEISLTSKYEISVFGLRFKDVNAGKSPVTETEQQRLNLIYQNMGILERAIQNDLKENKINIWTGVDLTKEANAQARDRFLEAIGEKSRE